MSQYCVLAIDSSGLLSLSIIGPFDTFELADDYVGQAEEAGVHETYIIRELEPISDDE